MNNILTQHFLFCQDVEISLTQSILNEGDYVLELKSTEDANYYQRIELTKEELLGIVGLVEKFELIKPQYIVSHDPYKEDGTGSSIGVTFSGPDYTWKSLRDCNLIYPANEK